ncbi:integral membrane protein MviN [Arthrobacter agilis]|uniref:murein biosynthesis integral membrane protein MurJ n=1 Tax=Arthrobacter agilis TaxID=37921 RepID=UPI000F6C8FCB|nr:murein biosynthesis integral membrane protein MurJ [Arthrobacter agilis]VDR33448.1 integral membrane protein MviN [Arthrobacter agilis]
MSVSRAAVVVTALTAVSTIFGFLRDVVIAAVYGAGPDLDAYLVAQGLMNVVLGLVAYAMARSVTPVIAREVKAEGAACRSHRSFDTAITVTMVVLGLGAVVVGLLAAPVTALLAPGFEGEQAELAVMLTRIVLLATVLIAGTDLLAAVAQAHGRVVWSSLQGVPFNIIMIGAAGLFGPRYGIQALAIGFVIGSAARLVLQFPPLAALGLRVRPRLGLRHPGFREIARLMPPLLVGSAISNVNSLVDRAVGSTLGDGAITALSYGWRLVNLPETLLIASLLVPLYPALGAAAGNLPEVRRLVSRGLSVTVTVLVPLTLVLMVAALPLVRVAYGRGEFTADDSAATAVAVLWYAPALVAMGVRQVLVSTSYALGDARAPVLVSVVAMVINVVGDILLAPVLGVAGIAVATSMSLVFAAIANGVLLARRHGAVDGAATRKLLVRATVIGAATVAVGHLTGRFLAAMLPEVGPLLEGALIGSMMLGAYVLGLMLLRAPERLVPLEMLRAVRRR